jgi:PPP family 3-phenylpropionic acid transporter
VRFFALYYVFYAAQALYGTYMNLFLGSVGFSKTQIGLMVSLSTACLLITQPFWGILSDKARYKNTVVAVLMGMAGLFSLAFPRIQKPGVMTLFVCLMAISFFPIGR